jgi:hypothetical protein
VLAELDQNPALEIARLVEVGCPWLSCAFSYERARRALAVHSLSLSRVKQLTRDRARLALPQVKTDFAERHEGAPPPKSRPGPFRRIEHDRRRCPRKRRAPCRTRGEPGRALDAGGRAGTACVAPCSWLRIVDAHLIRRSRVHVSASLGAYAPLLRPCAPSHCAPVHPRRAPSAVEARFVGGDGRDGGRAARG